MVAIARQLTHGRRWRIAAFVLAAITLTRTSTADSLWAVDTYGILGVCEDPSSQTSLDSCFSDGHACVMSQSDSCTNQTDAIATDGVNVYYAVAGGEAGVSCPISDLGATCNYMDPWPSVSLMDSADSMAAGDGWLYIGYYKGLIYRCPVGDNQATSCTQLDDAGDRGINALVLANGVLYAGLSREGEQHGSKNGLIWYCDPNEVNSCLNFNDPGKTDVYALVAGGGYLWAGLGNGIIWRCSLDEENSCVNWYSTGGEAIRSLSYDGETTIYASTNQNILSCSTNGGCTSVYDGLRPTVRVAAGAGSVFYSEGSPDPQFDPDPMIYFGSEQFVSSKLWSDSIVLYIPSVTDEEDPPITDE